MNQLKEMIIFGFASTCIFAITVLALQNGQDGNIVVFSITAIAGLAGYQINKSKLPPVP